MYFMIFWVFIVCRNRLRLLQDLYDQKGLKSSFIAWNDLLHESSAVFRDGKIHIQKETHDKKFSPEDQLPLYTR